MKKTHFKTYLFFEGNKIANEVLIYAALSNAGGKNIELRLFSLNLVYMVKGGGDCGISPYF